MHALRKTKSSLCYVVYFYGKGYEKKLSLEKENLSNNSARLEGALYEVRSKTNRNSLIT